MKINWLNRTALRLPYLALCTTEAQFKQALKAVYKTEAGFPAYTEPFLAEDHVACVHTLDLKKSGKTVCLVCLPIDAARPWYETSAVVAHEATHVVQRLFRYIGEDTPGDEAQAYAVENTVQYLLAEYDRQAKAQKTKPKKTTKK